MRLRFTHNYQILEVLQATEIELEQLQTTLTEKGFNFQKKETFTKCLFSQWRYIPAGLWSRVYDLRKKNWTVVIENLKDFLNTKYDAAFFIEWLEQLPISLTPYSYQIEAAFRAYKYRQGKIEVGTGGGKSLTQYLICRFLLEHMLPEGEKVLMIVPRTMLCNQMERDFNEYQEDDYIQVDKLYGGAKRNKLGNVVVANIDSAVNQDSDFFEQFGAVMFDEAHKMGSSDSYKKVFHFLNKNKLQLITGLSGTFHEKGIAALEQDAYLGPTIISVKAHELRDKYKTVSPFRIKVAVLHYDEETSRAYYNFEPIETERTRYHGELEFVRSIGKRIDLISNVINKAEGNHVLLFSSKKYMKLFKSVFEAKSNKQVFEISGDISVSERTRISDLLETIDDGVVFATYSTIELGVSIKNIKHLHFADTCKSFIRVLQSIGRAIRLHSTKDEALIWDWVDHFKKFDENDPGPQVNISYRHSKTRQKIYKEANYEYKIINLELKA